MSEIVEIVIQFQEILFSALVIRLQDAGRSLCIKVHTKFCFLLFVCTELASTYHIWRIRCVDVQRFLST